MNIIFNTKTLKSLSVLAPLALWLILLVLISGKTFAAPPALVWSKSLPSVTIRESSPMPINFNGGAGDVIFGARDGKVYVLNGDTGAFVANWPQQTSNPIDSTPSSGDVDGDGNTDIFIGSGYSESGQCSGGGLYRFNKYGTKLLNFSASDNAGESSVQCNDPAIHSSPVLADVTKDGATDVIFGALGLKFWNIRYDGVSNPGWPYYWDDTQFASVAIADLNGDGNKNIVVAGDSSPGAPVDHRGGMVRAFDSTGNQLWEYRINEIVRSSPSIGDVNGDGQLDVVFGAGNYWVNNGGASDATKIFVLNGRTGELIWSKDLNAQTLASPTLADFNGDGRLDIGMGTWDGVDPGKVWLLDGVTGSNLPNYPIASGGGAVIGQLTTADLDGDGAQDPIVTTGGAIFGYSSATGARLWGLRQGQASYQNSVLVEDIDSNGRLDLITVGTKPNGEGLIDRYQFGVSDPANLGSNGWHMFRKNDRLTGSYDTTPLTDAPSGASGLGYKIFDTTGVTYNFGSSFYTGSLGGSALTKPIISGASKKSSNGHWLVASDGGIFSFGDAAFHGSTGAINLNKPIVGMASTSSGNGYWLVASDGGIFSFGDAAFHGSTGAINLNKPIVGMASTASGNGYWLVASDGGIFSFGDAAFHGSTGAINLNKPIISMTRAPGNGYWLVASDGGIFSFNAPFYGSVGSFGADNVAGGVTVGY